MKSSATTVGEYLASLPAERRKELEPVLKVIRKRMPKGFEEAMAYGMINWQVPLTRFPGTYNKLPLCYAALASQKNHLAVYLMCVYGESRLAKAFAEGFRKAGKKLDMGKSCIRFKKAEDLALDAIGDAVAGVSMEEYVAIYEKSHAKK